MAAIRKFNLKNSTTSNISMDHFVKTVKLLNFAIITFMFISPVLEKVNISVNDN